MEPDPYAVSIPRRFPHIRSTRLYWFEPGDMIPRLATARVDATSVNHSEESIPTSPTHPSLLPIGLVSERCTAVFNNSTTQHAYPGGRTLSQCWFPAGNTQTLNSPSYIRDRFGIVNYFYRALGKCFRMKRRDFEFGRLAKYLQTSGQRS